MNARIAGFTDWKLWAVALAAALGLAACASQQNTAKNKSNASDYNTQLGIAYLRQGDIPLAKEKLDRALQENPSNPAVHGARAMLFDRMGEPAQADREFKTALSLAPDDPDVNNNYAVYLCQIGRTDEGVRRFEAVAHNALYRTPWVAYTNAGVCLRGAKKSAQAVKNFQLALQARPNFSEAAFQLGDLEFQDGHVTEARQAVDSYLGAFDETADLLLLRVRIAKAQNDRVAAAVYSRKLRLDFPSSQQAKDLAALDSNPG